MGAELPGVGPAGGARLRCVAGGAVAAALLADLLIWPVVAPFGVIPDSVLAVSLALAMAGRRREALGVAVGAGLVVDLAGGVLIGLGGAARALAVLAADAAAARLPAERFGVSAAVGALGALVCEAAQRLGAAAFGVQAPLSWAALARAAGFVLLTAALFAVAYTAISWARLAAPGPGWGRRWVR